MSRDRYHLHRPHRGSAHLSPPATTAAVPAIAARKNLVGNPELAKRAEVSGAQGSVEDPEFGSGVVVVAGLRRAVVELYFAIPSTESGIASAIKAIKESMRTIAIIDDWIRRAELSLQEALINGHYHGNGADPGKELRIGGILSPSKLEIFVEDDGSGYHGPKNFSGPGSTERHGRGLFLIHQLMNRVEIERNGSRIVMSLGREKKHGNRCP